MRLAHAVETARLDRVGKIAGGAVRAALLMQAILPTLQAAANNAKKGNAMKTLQHMPAFVAASLLASAIAPPAAAEDYDHVLRLDHYVGVRSTVPAIAGQTTPIFVREVVRAASALRDRNIASRVVLFIHGAGTPAEVAFDVPYQDYSWMAFLAKAGYDVFSMDTEGYGRTSRPPAMNDACNLSPEQQKQFMPSVIGKPCPASYPYNITTIASDWNDVGAV